MLYSAEFNNNFSHFWKYSEENILNAQPKEMNNHIIDYTTDFHLMAALFTVAQ